jgi:hypothetical protein
MRTDRSNKLEIPGSNDEQVLTSPSIYITGGIKFWSKQEIRAGARVWCADEQIPHSTWHERVLSDRDFAIVTVAAAKRRRAIGGPVDATHRRNFDAERR